MKWVNQLKVLQNNSLKTNIFTHLIGFSEAEMYRENYYLIHIRDHSFSKYAKLFKKHL